MAAPSPGLAGLALAAVPAFLGYVAAGVEARALATAVIGGRVEGRPLRLRESIAIARRRFWTVLGAQVVVGIIAAIASALGQILVVAVVRSRRGAHVRSVARDLGRDRLAVRVRPGRDHPR